MELRVQTTTRQEQRFALLPKMLQSIEVLQLATVDLVQRIQAEIEQNEVLEVREESEPVELPLDRDGRDQSGDEGEDGGGEGGFDQKAYRARAPTAAGDETDWKQLFLSNVPATTGNLLDYVELQVGCLDLPHGLMEAVLTLAQRLDERGLLTASDEELQEVLDAELLPDALTVLQSLEPRGIGARDTIGAMLLQLPGHDPDLSDIERMLRQHLDDLARNKLPDVARALGRTLDEMHGLMDRIRKLDPRPGSRFADDNVGVVTPDVEVRLEAGEPVVEVDNMSLPDLGVSETYEQMAASTETEGEVREYLRDKIKSARGLIDAVEQRRRTLARVTTAIMRHQREFLERGKCAVRPLRMSEVAAELGLHPSTVSRAIAGKHVQTERGIFPLREFFDGDRRINKGGGGTVGRLGIKDHIQRLVAAEDSQRPLSDDQLVRMLAENKIRVARRTVAKYRGELGIPSSYRRRAYQD